MARLDADAVLRDFGARIAELRVAKDMTQQEFAEFAGFTVKYLQRVEAGRANLTIRSLVEFANRFDVSVVDLLARPARRASKPGRPSKARKARPLPE